MHEGSEDGNGYRDQSYHHQPSVQPRHRGGRSEQPGSSRVWFFFLFYTIFKYDDCWWVAITCVFGF